MKLIDLCIGRPVTVWVGVLLVSLFSVIALLRLPVQMRPTVDKPEVVVSTLYPGAAPPEIEQQITNKLEEKLASVEDVKRITSTSRENQSEIRLEFDWGVDRNLASINALKKINLVQDLPEEAQESIIKAVSSDEEQPIMFIFAKAKPGAAEPFDAFKTFHFCDQYIRPRLERVSGVGDVWLFGGPEREIRVVLDPERLSGLGLTIGKVRDALSRENLNVRGGPLERGKIRETARTVGQFTSLDQIADVIVAVQDGRPIYVRDFATVQDSYKEVTTSVRQSGQPTVVAAIVRRTGSNTLQVVESVERELRRINTELLANSNFEFEVVYKDSTYIRESIDNVVESLWLGAALATVVLLFSLRSVIPTLIIALTIPTSLIGTFVFIYALGRTLNIVSLAGLGFASGMVVDNAIVVLENCFRHMEEGKPRREAARYASNEVWVAVLASTLTTMAVFIPIVFLKVEAGQLFKDIAIAIAFAIGLSLIVSITLVPMLCSRWLRVTPREAIHKVRRRLIGWITLEPLGRAVNAAFVGLTAWTLRGYVRKVVVTLVILALSVGAARVATKYWDTVDTRPRPVWRPKAERPPARDLAEWLFPPLDYLPAGSRNFIFGFVFLPPGTTIDRAKAVCQSIEDQVKDRPETDRYFTVALVGSFVDNSFVGVQLKQEALPRLDPFVDEVQWDLWTRVPGMRFPPGAIIFKMPVFIEAIGGNSVEVDLRGDDLAELAAYAGEVEGQLYGIPGVQSVQNTLDLGNPERRVVPDPERCAALGFKTSDVADVIQTLVGGSLATTFKEGGKEYDLTLIGAYRGIKTAEDLENVILHAPDGSRVTLRDLASVNYALGPTKIEHIDQLRSVALKVTVDRFTPLQTVAKAIDQQIVQPLRERLPSGYSISLYGAADRLSEALQALLPSIVLAVLITYLVMCSLYESFTYPFIIMFTVPMSWAGAMLGLFVLRWMHFRGIIPGLPEFNIITLLGFVILTGVIVNNGILIVDQALQYWRTGTPQNEAIQLAVRHRIRPIYMTTITTILGTLPLAIGGGSGTELYTGLGAAVLGGMAFATVFTLILVPAAFALFLDTRRWLRRLLHLTPAADDLIPVKEELAAGTP